MASPLVVGTRGSMQKRKNPGKLSDNTQKSAWNGLEKSFPGLDRFGADNSRPKKAVEGVK